MNQKLLFVLLIIACTFGYITYESIKLESKFSSYNNLQTNTVIKELPKVSLPVFESDEVYDFINSASNGNNLIVHFWATWCGPCEKEFPELLKLTSLLEKKENVKFLFVAVNDEKKNIQKFLKKFSGYKNYKILIDNDSVHQKSFGTFRLPETFVFKSDRSVIRKFTGAQDWTQKHFVEFLYNL